MCLGYAVFFGNIVLMPLWLQSNLGYTATWAGLVSAPSGITAILTSMMMGQLMRRFDPRVLAASSFGSVRAFLLHARAAHGGLELSGSSWRRSWCKAWPWACSSSRCSRWSFDGLPAQKVPAASGLSNFLRITAAGFATSLITTFWDRREALHQSQLADAVTQYAPAYQEALTRMHQFGLDRSSWPRAP